jgi:hypothetical protein
MFTCSSMRAVLFGTVFFWARADAATDLVLRQPGELRARAWTSPTDVAVISRCGDHSGCRRTGRHLPFGTPNYDVQLQMK